MHLFLLSVLCYALWVSLFSTSLMFEEATDSGSLYLQMQTKKCKTKRHIARFPQAAIAEYLSMGRLTINHIKVNASQHGGHTQSQILMKK